jgi:hypothetical protein
MNIIIIIIIIIININVLQLFSCALYISPLS